MSRIARIALPLAAAVAFSAAGPASADVTVPGCFGAVVVYCDPTVGQSDVVETYSTTVPVCAGTCVDVPVTLVRLGSGSTLVCVTVTPRGGTPEARCVGDLRDTVNDLRDLAVDKIGVVIDLAEETLTAVCQSLTTVSCHR